MKIDMAPKSAKAAVRNGAKLLDDVDPHWYEVICLDELHMGDAHQCIVGQLAAEHLDERSGGWSSVVDRLLGDYYFDLVAPRYERVVKLAQEDPEIFGFDVMPNEGWGYPKLRRCWTKEIRTRLTAPKPGDLVALAAQPDG